MSRAFTKDDDGDNPPLRIPARAPLPEGVVNYVTARGLESLRAELAELHAIHAPNEDPANLAERSRAHLLVHARIADLEARIASAEVVDPSRLPHDEIRFGATATVRTEEGDSRRYQIVGVDEADVDHGRVAFIAPLARALLGKHVGDTVVVRTPRGEDELEVVAIAYD